MARMLPRVLRPDIGRRLALQFLALVLIGLALIHLAESAVDRHAEFAQIVDEAGRLRMLTRAIAHAAHQYPGNRQVVRVDIGLLREQFDGGLAKVLNYQNLLGNEDAAKLTSLRQGWRECGLALNALLALGPGHPDTAEALLDVDLAADRVLARTEAVVAAVMQSHERERTVLRIKLYAVLSLGLAFTGIAYWRIRRRIVQPIARIGEMMQRFSAGQLDARVREEGDDELGDLLRVINRSAADTQQLFHRTTAAEQAMVDSERRNSMLWETSTDGILMMDRDNIIRHCNPALEAIFGYAGGELLGRPLDVLQPPALREAHRKGFDRYLTSGRRTIHWQAIEIAALHKDGREIPVELSFTHIRLSGAEWFAAFFRDVSHRALAQEAMRLRDRAMASTGEGIMITEAAARPYAAIYVNPAFCQISGYAAEELVGRNPRFLLDGNLDQAEIAALLLLLREQRDGAVVLQVLRKSGEFIWIEMRVSPMHDAQGRRTHNIWVVKDVCERKRQEEELLRSAHQDALTGLANRVLFTDRIAQAIAAAHRHQRQVGVLFIDLDNFKLINDSMGHETGDRLLQETARRLQNCLREGDTAARLGGDEFVLLLNDMEQEDDIAHVAERVLASIARPYGEGDREFFVGASIGAAIYPRDGGDAATLLKNADIAMYRAKDQGRNNFQVFTSEMQQRISLRLSMETSLRRALEREEFALFYQPQVDLQSGRIVGAEALIRWRHPEMGLVSPVQFIPLAEETGLIVPIGEWVLDAACAQARAWLDSGQVAISVGVNLSARQFRQKNLLQVIEQSLRMNQLDSLHLELELTESMVMQDPDNTIRLLNQLKDLGLRLSLDDFGTGYSSLSHLRRFPIDVLKVDQSFVREVTANEDDARITSSIIQLAHGLQLSVIAEGVETQAQLHYLKRQSCDAIQGYYFSRPVPADEFFDLLRAERQLGREDLQA